MRTFRALLGMTLVTGLLVVAPSALAAQKTLFSSSFGAFSVPIGVAVNQATGHVYVADAAGTVGDFEASGAPDPTAPLLTGAPFVTPYGVAVDESSNVATKEDLYVSDVSNDVVYQFAPDGVATGLQISQASIPVPDRGAEPFLPTGVAVDSHGNVFVADISNSVVDEFSPAGVFVSQVGSSVSIPGPQLIAVDAADDLYVAAGLGVVEFDPAGSCVNASCAPLDAAGTSDVAVDGAGDVFVSEVGRVSEYDAAHTLVEQFGGPTSVPAFGGLADGLGVAVNDSTHAVYVTDPGVPAADIFSPTVIPDVTTSAPSPLTATSATLNATVNPDETEVSTCQFEYGPAAGVYTTGTVPCTQTLPLTGDLPVPVSSPEITGLLPNQTYHYRLFAANEHATNQTQDQTFTTATVPPMIEGESVTSVGATSAELQAQVNPNRTNTHYYFQYGTTIAYTAGTVPNTTGIAVGAGETGQPARVAVSGLQPNTTYHYHVVAFNELGGKTETTEGLDQTFTTPQASPATIPPEVQNPPVEAASVGVTPQPPATYPDLTTLTPIPGPNQPAGKPTTKAKVKLCKRGQVRKKHRCVKAPKTNKTNKGGQR